MSVVWTLPCMVLERCGKIAINVEWSGERCGQIDITLDVTVYAVLSAAGR